MRGTGEGSRGQLAMPSAGQTRPRCRGRRLTPGRAVARRLAMPDRPLYSGRPPSGRGSHVRRFAGNPAARREILSEYVHVYRRGLRHAVCTSPAVRWGDRLPLPSILRSPAGASLALKSMEALRRPPCERSADAVRQPPATDVFTLARVALDSVRSEKNRVSRRD
jgi:hypothetical protein